MDSGNSGSMQSSSGGDEEYDSRAESISAFLNPPGHVGPMPNPPQPPPPPPHHHHHHHTHSSSMFDPLSNYFDPLSRSPTQLQNPNSLLNLDMVWSKTLRSDPNCTEIGGILASSSSTPPFSGAQGQIRATFPSSLPSMPFPPAPENAARATASASNDQTNVARNPKKRSRASRRAPTTVLTTDTTNFRAMVQEFTGIPAQPFTSSPFPRSRLDLFGTASTMRSGHLDHAPPSYLLRPFAQKLQPPPFASPPPSSSSSFSSSSMVDAIASTTNITSGSASNTSSNSTSINYQLPSDLGLVKQPQNLLNMNVQNPILSIQSFLQTPLKYPHPNSAIMGSKPQGSLEIPSTDSHIKMGGLEDFGLSHGHVNTHLSGLPNLVSSDRTASRSDNNPPSWNDGLGSSGGDHGQLGPLNGNYNNSQRVTNGKMNYSASSSDFHGDKVPENVSTRSEGMVESWICSSD